MGDDLLQFFVSRLTLCVDQGEDQLRNAVHTRAPLVGLQREYVSDRTGVQGVEVLKGIARRRWKMGDGREGSAVV